MQNSLGDDIKLNEIVSLKAEESDSDDCIIIEEYVKEESSKNCINDIETETDDDCILIKSAEVENTTTEENPLKCPCEVCKKRFKTCQNVETDGETYKCIVCRREFAYKTSLIIHLRRVHIGTNSNTNKKTNTCVICQQTFSSHTGLYYHILNHTKEIVQCGFCGKTCTNEEDLKLHTQTHIDSFLENAALNGKPIGSQGREIVSNVMRFMLQEAGAKVKMPRSQYRKRAVAATGVGVSTYQKVAAEGRKRLDSANITPQKKRQRIAPILDKVTPGLIEAIKTIIYDIYILEKRRPTLKCILQKIKERGLDFDGKIPTLNKLLKRMGFRWRNTSKFKKALLEKFEIRFKRMEYLKQIMKYRAEDRYIVYTDKTYLRLGYRKSNRGKKPRSKEQHLIVVHAGGEKGFLRNTLIFKSIPENEIYYEKMSHENFINWVKAQLIPNLPQQSVLVVNNSQYHNVTVEENITPDSLKTDMSKWLHKHGIEFQENWTKPELYRTIQENKFRFSPKYKLDALMEQHGHSVLRLPPYHPELNPIEKIWTVVKDWVASNKVKDVRQLGVNKFEAEWKETCEHVKNYEKRQIERERLLDHAIDELVTIFTIDSETENELDINMLSSSDSE